MTRDFFLFLSRRRWVRKWMEGSTTARKFTRRFVAGDTLDDGAAVCAGLQREKLSSSLDHLGENVGSLEDAGVARDAYLEALDKIAEQKLSSTISLKLTQMGLDFSEDACLENVRALVRRASQVGTRIEIDMESTAYTDRILRLVERIAGECGCVRAVIQAYLFRSEADIERLNRLGIPVRLCKGAYLEPHSAAFAA
jgi:proline dehydrogenase